MKRIPALIVIIGLLLIQSSCGRQARTHVSALRFAVIGNTCPESPFFGFTDHLDLLFGELNRVNPQFIIHMGNIVYGGNRWMGIKEVDLKRQYGKFNDFRKSLSPPVYTVIGSKDGLDGDYSLYRKFTGRKEYYSFNYGAIHFIVLKTSGGDRMVDPRQMKWLERELVAYADAQAVIVFAHHPLFIATGKKLSLKAGEKLHRLFKSYPVKAVFSGSLDRPYQVDHEGILYYVAGTRLLYEKGWSRYRTRYYIVDFNGGAFKVEEKELDVK